MKTKEGGLAWFWRRKVLVDEVFKDLRGDDLEMNNFANTSKLNSTVDLKKSRS